LLLLLLQGLRAERITTGTKENLEKLGQKESLEREENFHLVSLMAVLGGQEKVAGVLQNEAREAIFYYDSFIVSNNWTISFERAFSRTDFCC
jgi:hypothetical protein